MTVKAHISVTKVRWNEQAVAAVLANDPGIQGAILAKAGAVAGEAKTRIGNSAKVKVPKSAKVKSPGGIHYSERPDAVARMVSVKPAAPLRVFTTGRGAQMPVALVVADHPYSHLYQTALTSALVANSGGRWKAQGVTP